MMAKGCRLAGALVVLAALLGTVGAGPPVAMEPPAVSRLKISLPGGPQQPAVEFSHRRHEARRVDCRQCHHEYRLGGRNVWQKGQPVQQCQACHGPSPRKNRLDLKSAFHLQCRGCHLKRRQRQAPGGPIRCQECHRQG